MLLATAERCYRLARGIADRQAIEALLKVAEECEAQAEELRNQTRGQGSHHHFRHVESPGRGARAVGEPRFVGRRRSRAAAIERALRDAV